MYNNKLFVSSLYINQIMNMYDDYMCLFIKLLRDEKNIDIVKEEYKKVENLVKKIKKYYSVIDYNGFDTLLNPLIRQTELNIFMRFADKIHEVYDEFERLRLKSMELIIKLYNEENKDAIK